MKQAVALHLFLVALVCFSVLLVRAEDEFKYFTWVVTYGTIAPLGVSQQGILINGQFPGPQLDSITNDNMVINVFNYLDEPFLITWHGIYQKKDSWQDGVLGTNCPIPPNSNFTYQFQTKDQIGSYMYYPSTLLHKAAGGFGGLTVYDRSVITFPYDLPAGDFTLIIGDWYKTSHKELQQTLDSGKTLPFPDAILINGQTNNTFTGDQGKTYMFRVSNVGLSTSFNFRIQGHKLTLVECEGSHTMQEIYDSLDVHVGQSVAVLVTLDQPSQDYFIVASSRFTKPIITTTAVLHYSNCMTPPTEPLPAGPTYQIHWSMKQARTIRWNLTANAARPNPQGSYHYGTIPIQRTLILANSEAQLNGKLQYAVNSVSYVNPDTPLKLADYFNILGVYDLNTIQDSPTNGPVYSGTSVIGITLHDFVEIVFQNNENTIQSWHLDGYNFWVVGYGSKQWTPTMRKRYNLVDAVARHTVQVYPNSWSAILVSSDNKGMWSLRSQIWARQYLGQQLYLRVWNNVTSLYTEYDIPSNAILCGKAAGLQI
ncbi:hypothetical protein NE237_017137 [Protea cynaroides]|uniref:L-ascorbate oxidase n=1 Tax=Protea cynaroides TaxID=273540 RepID=A0A9Q0K7G6_9MAGN|nr:hypothetical protein NE237_017137 [Protea cynaroides]